MKIRILLGVALTVATTALPAVLRSQSIRISLEQTRSLARVGSSQLRAARDAVEAARGRETQASAFPNPELVYSVERTSGAGERNTQQIAAIEQRVEIGGQRVARRLAANLRRRAAEARLEDARTLVDFEVARAYAEVVAADRRAALARHASTAFVEAARVSGRRLAAGDISVYADRRLKLEAARYAALAGEATLGSQSARVALSALISPSEDSIDVTTAILTDSVPNVLPPLSLATLSAAALRNRDDYQEGLLEVEALAADARLASAERIPSPAFTGGYKTEKSHGIPGSLDGFVAGIAFPLPLFDRRSGAIQAARAETRKADANRETLRRQIVREVRDAYNALVTVEQQRAILAPQLGAPAASALRSAHVAYSEGEITLLEWLDAVRAYHEAESTYSNLVAESLIRRATLERVVASPLATLAVAGHLDDLTRPSGMASSENQR
ncbi:MAG TPA: TolC family protein [Gemmatimonadaceae bacterium]|nr:TolC family protein [Gemmatimonadaceae bacterium]